MPEAWTGDLIGRMHVEEVYRAELAEEMNVTPAYVSMLLHGRRSPPGAREKLTSAFERVLKKRGRR